MTPHPLTPSPNSERGKPVRQGVRTPYTVSSVTANTAMSQQNNNPI
jgi:hypothetical protein